MTQEMINTENTDSEQSDEYILNQQMIYVSNVVNEKLTQFVQNFQSPSTLSRNSLNGSHTQSNCADVDTACRYPEQITFADYMGYYKRFGIANRVVSIYPTECWVVPPNIFETEEADDTPWEDALRKLLLRSNLYKHVRDADILSGIGTYGGLFLGLPGASHTPIDGLVISGRDTGDVDAARLASKEKHNINNLLYVRPLNQEDLVIHEFNKDTTSPRYGMPEFYKVRLATESSDVSANSQPDNPTITVHWSRIIHMSDDSVGSKLYGAPRMELVWNQLMGLKRVLGATSWGYWGGAFPTHVFEAIDGREFTDEMKAELKPILNDFVEQITRFLTTVGTNHKVIKPDAIPPTEHTDTIFKAIVIAIGVPWRIFLGSEAGHLASDQDRKNWDDRLVFRKDAVVSPYIRTILTRLIAANALPAPQHDITINWPDAGLRSANDVANIAFKQAAALQALTLSGVFNIITPVDALVEILGMDKSRALQIVAAAGESDNLAIVARIVETLKSSGQSTGQDNLAKSDGAKDKDSKKPKPKASSSDSK